jgi:hypothetical protein
MAPTGEDSRNYSYNVDVTAATTVRRAAEILCADVAGEMVLVDPERGQYFGLDDIASVVWCRLEHPTSVGELCAALLADYECDAVTIANDVIALLERLAADGLIEAVP